MGEPQVHDPYTATSAPEEEIEQIADDDTVTADGDVSGE